MPRFLELLLQCSKQLLALNLIECQPRGKYGLRERVSRTWADWPRGNCCGGARFQHRKFGTLQRLRPQASARGGFPLRTEPKASRVRACLDPAKREYHTAACIFE